MVACRSWPVHWGRACRTEALRGVCHQPWSWSARMWRDAATGTWSAFVFGTEPPGFVPAAAQAAALRLARAQLEEGLRRIGELEPAGHGAGARVSPPPEPPRPA